MPEQVGILQRDGGIVGIQPHGFLQVGLRAIKIVAAKPYGGAHAQELGAGGALDVHLIDHRFGDGDLLLRGFVVARLAIDFGQIQSQFNRIELTFRHRGIGQVGNRRLIFADGVRIAILRPRKLCLKRVQAIVIGIDLRGAGKERSRTIHLSRAQLCLCRAQLQPDLPWRKIGGLGVGFRRLLLIAIKFVAVAEIGQHLEFCPGALFSAEIAAL